MVEAYAYTLVNIKDDLDDMIDDLKQLQEDIPEYDPKFIRIDKIINHLELAISELE